MVEMSSELFKKIRRIQYQTTRLADDILAGAYKSAFRGQGMEFEEVREYQSGDEVRAIDWNVTARMDHLYVKSFREEREMTVILAVDISASTLFGSGKIIKRELIAEIAALLAFSAIKNNDKVGLILFSTHVEKYFQPNKGVRHVLKVIRELLLYEPIHKGTNIGAALSFLGKVQQRAGICFLISDFISPDYSHQAALIASKHDLVGMAIIDPYEKELPNMNLASFTDLETNKESLVDTSSPKVKSKLRETAKERIITQEKLMNKLGASFLQIDSNSSYLPQLRKFFILRQRQLR